jgi:hypothetical protein
MVEHYNTGTCTIRVGHDYVCLNFGSNSAASVSVQDRGTRSGPKIIAELRELARQHTPAAIEELARLALKARNEAVRISAIHELLDRGYGKAPTSLPVPIDLPVIGGELKGNVAVLAAYKSVFEAVADARPRADLRTVFHAAC